MYFKKRNGDSGGGGGGFMHQTIGEKQSFPSGAVSPMWNPCCKVAINPAQRSNFVGAPVQN